ncbi:hypothetical protein SO694_00001549 [Aureococcus anophagefferens]|uniref:EF-hand domain-containing protein n=1 Tax=Aureococcus anophagefferens TaxID=44056 RepID=A0ABR1GC25_AURAN
MGGDYDDDAEVRAIRRRVDAAGDGVVPFAAFLAWWAGGLDGPAPGDGPAPAPAAAPRAAPTREARSGGIAECGSCARRTPSGAPRSRRASTSTRRRPAGPGPSPSSAAASPPPRSGGLGGSRNLAADAPPGAVVAAPFALVRLAGAAVEARGRALAPPLRPRVPRRAR